ncbi:MAG: DUF2164 domain-containing protein [Rhodanobacter sp.]
MAIEISRDARKQAIASIERYFHANMDEKLSSLGAEMLLDFFLKEIGPIAYNAAVAEVQLRLQARVMEIDMEVYEDEFQYWKSSNVRRKST